MERVAEWRSSGLTCAKYCEGKPFTPGGLRHWAWRLRQIDQVKPAASMRFAKVVLSHPEPIRQLETQHSLDALLVEVGGLRVAVRPGFDRATLAAVIDVLIAREARP